MQDTGAVDAAPTPEPRSRRRLLGAGLVGLAGTLLPPLSARVAASTPPDTGDTATGDTATADTEPAATTTTAPPRRPTDDDVTLLGFAQSLELAAVELYDQALGGGSVDDQTSLLTTLREAHQAYAHVLGGFLGTKADGVASAEVSEQFGEGFGGSLDDVVAAAYDLETTAVATHTELIGMLEGTEGAALLASVLVAEARHATVLADLAGADLDAQLTSDATALEPTKG